jgi:hypothetical protein
METKRSLNIFKQKVEIFEWFLKFSSDFSRSFPKLRKSLVFIFAIFQEDFIEYDTS